MNVWQSTSLSPYLIVGAVVGLVSYSLVRAHRRETPEATPATEAGLCGAGIAAGLHLSFAAICPEYLLHLLDKDGGHIDKSTLLIKVGNTFEPANLQFALGEFHLVHIFLAGIATAIVAGGGLYKFSSQNPSRRIH